MFCMAIPKESANAPAAVRLVSPFSTPAKTTPTAIPSGILCRATARIIFIERGSFDLGPSAIFSSMCWCGMMLSRSNRKQIPAAKPARTGHEFENPSPLCSNAGWSKDQKLAATITPEANPSMALLSIPDILSRNMNTIAAPITVPRKGIVSPMIISISSNVFIRFALFCKNSLFL